MRQRKTRSCTFLKIRKNLSREKSTIIFKLFLAKLFNYIADTIERLVVIGNGIMKLKRNKYIVLLLAHLIFILAGCSHQPSLGYSSRNITIEEQQQINYEIPFYNRLPADDSADCATGFLAFLKPKPKTPKNVTPPLPELSQLNPEKLKFSNGKSYTLYRANSNVMRSYPDYDAFLEETAEIIFEPVEPFGHIRLRVGKKVYSFSNVQWTQANAFSPRMIPKSTKEEMPSSQGFVFQIGKEKIDKMRDQIDELYKTSASHNIPPFDAYSPMLKIVESDGPGGKILKYETTSPKFGNTQRLTGEIIQENGTSFLRASNGLEVPVVKKGKDYYTQSYSCSSSAAHILEKFFGIHVSHNYSAKAIVQSLSNGNINESIAPTAIMRYYEE